MDERKAVKALDRGTQSSQKRHTNNNKAQESELYCKQCIHGILFLEIENAA